ncbi:hypothetical protein GCM10022376_06960 [Yimella lutea]
MHEPSRDRDYEWLGSANDCRETAREAVRSDEEEGEERTNVQQGQQGQLSPLLGP